MFLYVVMSFFISLAFAACISNYFYGILTPFFTTFIYQNNACAEKWFISMAAIWHEEIDMKMSLILRFTYLHRVKKSRQGYPIWNSSAVKFRCTSTRLNHPHITSSGSQVTFVSMKPSWLFMYLYQMVEEYHFQRFILLRCQEGRGLCM